MVQMSLTIEQIMKYFSCFKRNRADDAGVEEEGINYLKQKLFKGCHQSQNVT